MKTISDTPINFDLNQADKSVGTYRVYSDVMKKVYKRVAELSISSDVIVIIGELGVGKRHIAKLIHSMSMFSANPFQNVHNQLLEELIQLRISAMKGIPKPESYLLLEDLGIDVKSGGTLFFELFSDLTLFDQKKVIELLYDSMKRTSNGNGTARFRPVFSVTLNSEEDLVDAPYWNDLVRYFNPSVIRIPPLRERCEDITSLLDHFLIEHADRNEKPVHAISYRAAYKCISYHWPGNVQQLKNVVEHVATIVPHGSVITKDLLPFSIDWKPATHANRINIDRNVSFMRAEKLLLNKLVSNMDFSTQQSKRLEHEFKFPLTKF